MVKPPKSAPEGNPNRGDQILKRMLQTKPKPHKEMVGKKAPKSVGVRNKSK